jgi:ribosomal protein L7/L12
MLRTWDVVAALARGPRRGLVLRDARRRRADHRARAPPPWALYWLWRTFWCKEDDLLERTLRRCDEHRSPVVMDAAALLRQILGGERTLGHIQDVLALRDSFLVSLDPSLAPAGTPPLAALGLGDAALERLEQRRRKEQAELRARAERERAAVWTVLLVDLQELLPVMKLVRELAGLGLKEAKDLLGARPAAILTGVTRAAAEQAAERLRAVGAVVELRAAS